MYLRIVLIIGCGHAIDARADCAIFVGRSQKASRAFSEFKKQIDYWMGDIVRYRLFFRLSARKHDPTPCGDN